jgi:hypothetical protein
MKKLLCWLIGHTKLKRTVDDIGIPYPGYCERCCRFIKDEIYEQQNKVWQTGREFLAALKKFEKV